MSSRLEYKGLSLCAIGFYLHFRRLTELTGTQRRCVARRMLSRTVCGAMPLRVRERPVSPHRPFPEKCERSPVAKH